jgi:hypothetical protein
MSISTPKVKPVPGGPVRVATAALAAVIAVVAALAATGCGGSQDEETLDLVRIRNPQGDTFVVDTAPKGREFSAGDTNGFVDELQENGEWTGTLIGHCTTVHVGGPPYSICDLTLDLRDRGTLAAVGEVDFDYETFEGAIVGGTGDFDTASGTVSAELSGPDKHPFAVDVITED